MNVSLTAEVEEFIKKQVESGRYVTASEVVRDAMRMFMDDEMIRQKALDEIRQKIQVGLDQLDAGQKVVLDKDLIEDLKARGRKRLGSQKRRVA